jgi:hypothetical protein
MRRGSAEGGCVELRRERSSRTDENAVREASSTASAGGSCAERADGRDAQEARLRQLVRSNVWFNALST